MDTIRFLITTLTFLSCFLAGHAQPGAEIEVKKPKKYENRKLASEKTGEKNLLSRENFIRILLLITIIILMQTIVSTM